MSEKLFDASRYLTQLEGQEYLGVKWRLLWLSSSSDNKGPREGRGATEAQVKAILAIGRSQYNWNDLGTNKRSIDLFGKDVKELSCKQASEFIDKLKTQRSVL